MGATAMIKIAFIFWLALAFSSGSALAGGKGKAFRLALAGQDSTVQVRKSQRDGWFAADKYSHVSASAFLVAGQMFAFKYATDMSDKQARSTAAVATLVIGVGKEIYDKVSGKGTASIRDLVADGVGIGFGILIFSIN